MSVERTFKGVIHIRCCYKGEIKDEKKRPVTKHQTKSRFDSTLREWENDVYEKVYNKYHSIAMIDCEKVCPECVLCYFDLRVIDVYEDGEPECPEWVREHINIYEKEAQRYQEMADRAKISIEEMTVEEFYGHEKRYNEIKELYERFMRNNEKYAIQEYEAIERLLNKYPECR